MSVHHFCTYCDQGYAARMLCLFTSLKRQGEAFRLFVLCFDKVTEAVVRARGEPSLVAVPLDELLAADPELAAVRSSRSKVEFFFTSTPCVVKHCLRLAPEAERMTYLDADLYFFAPASAVFSEQVNASVGIIPHGHPEHRADLLEFGRYNVGWVSFARDVNGLACLAWWRERCLEWCHDRVENGRFADQRYLDQFPVLFRGVQEIEHPGANLAPWNVGGARITFERGGPQVKGAPVLFYHYQGVRELEPALFDPSLRAYNVSLTAPLREMIYRPYLVELSAMQRRLLEEHGIAPVRGYQRLSSGAGWHDRWTLFKARFLRVPYRRLLGELVKLDPA